MAVPRSTKGAAFSYADYLTWPTEERWELIEGTAYRDQGQKLLLYARHGVREYWIVNPAGKSVTVYLRDEKEGGFGKPLFFNHTDRLSATALGGLAVGLEKAFRV